MGNRWWLRETREEVALREAIARRNAAVAKFQKFFAGLTPREKEELTEIVASLDHDEALLMHSIRTTCDKH
jgi:hypothetical protein